MNFAIILQNIGLCPPLEEVCAVLIIFHFLPFANFRLGTENALFLIKKERRKFYYINQKRK